MSGGVFGDCGGAGVYYGELCPDALQRAVDALALGDVLIADGAGGITGATPGADGEVLTSTGPGAAPTFQDRRGYSCINGENQNGTISLGAISTWSLYDQFERVGAERNATGLAVAGDAAQNRITVDNAGDYYMSFAGDQQTAAGTSAGQTFQWEIFTNGLRTTLGGGRFIAGGTAGDNSAVCGEAIMTLAAGTVVELYVRCTTAATAAIKGRDMTLSAQRLD